LNVPPEILVQPERLLVVEPGGRTSVWVQAIGRGLQYQWCKRAEDDPSLSETTQQHIFQEHASEFKKCVNAANLCSFLFNAHLITAEQMEELMHDVVGNTNAKKSPATSAMAAKELYQLSREAHPVFTGDRPPGTLGTCSKPRE
jgi:hypothetical protein